MRPLLLWAVLVPSLSFPDTRRPSSSTGTRTSGFRCRNALEMYQGLRDLGVETRLALYKGFGHGLNKPKALRHALQENLDWFDKHLFGATSAK